MRTYTLLTLAFALLIGPSTLAQNNRSIAEKLGYEKDAKLLIIHADDLGVAHSENVASIDAYEKGGINSASIMVPCPWFPEIVQYAKDHPDFDLGLHLTLTAEWSHYKWGGVASSNEITSLLNEDGYFYATSEAVAQHANPEEVETELRAQIEKALAAGIKPTHLDSHMGSLFTTPELFRVYIKMSKEYDIPAFLPLNNPMASDEMGQLMQKIKYPVNNLIMAPTETPPEKWIDYYIQAINNLEPGLNEIIVHLAYDNEEMQAVTADHEYFDAKWRQRDYDFVVSDELKKAIVQNDIKLVTWKEIQQLD